jgi:hypothetical protein
MINHSIVVHRDGEEIQTIVSSQNFERIKLKLVEASCDGGIWISSTNWLVLGKGDQLEIRIES